VSFSENPTKEIEANTNSDTCPVKVCVVNPNFYRSSGVTVAIRTIHSAMSGLGVEQSFVSCKYKEGDQDTSWIPTRSLRSFCLMDSNPIVLTKELCALASWLRLERIRIVHVHHRRLAVILCSSKALHGCKVVYTGHLTYPFATWFWPVQPDIATAVSKSVAYNMRSTTRINNVNVIGNPVCFPTEYPVRIKEDAVVDAVCIGRLEPVKGHEHLICAWSILAERGFRAKLALVGEGSLRGQLQRQVNKSGLGDLVEFRGFKADIKTEILRAKFGVLTSQVEGQAFAVIEAASCGRATLLTDVDGSRDCLPPNRMLPNGVPFGDLATLASTLQTWLTNPETVKQEGHIFFDFLRRTNSMEVVGQSYARVYRQISFKN
jgi:glycosyltransferase involved in cell wall biosynthesis